MNDANELKCEDQVWLEELTAALLADDKIPVLVFGNLRNSGPERNGGGDD